MTRDRGASLFLITPKDPPADWSEALLADMQAETEAVLERFAWGGEGFLDLLSTNQTNLTPRLAAYYDLPAPDAEGQKSDGDRIAIRGNWLRRTVLCQNLEIPEEVAASFGERLVGAHAYGDRPRAQRGRCVSRLPREDRSHRLGPRPLRCHRAFVDSGYDYRALVRGLLDSGQCDLSRGAYWSMVRRQVDPELEMWRANFSKTPDTYEARTSLRVTRRVGIRARPAKIGITSSRRCVTSRQQDEIMRQDQAHQCCG